MSSDRIAAWTLLAFALAVALIALIFSILAWADGGQSQPHSNLERRDLKLTGDLIVDGETHL
jgi:hypothetical protein